MAIPDLKVPSFSVPDLKVPDLKVPDLHIAGAYNVYNHRRTSVQRQHLKDLGDILLGNPVTGTLQLQHTLEDYGLKEYKYIPVMNRVIGLGLMLNERFFKPLFKEGDVPTVIINSLETTGGTLDTLSNPVKSLFPWAGGGGSDDLAKSMGWAEGEYRKQYQFDTGNFIADVVLETVADPSNWLTFGGKQLAATATDVGVATARRSFRNVISEGVEQTITDKGMKVFAEAIEYAITKESDDVIETIFKRLKDNRDSLIETLSKTNKSSPGYKQIQAILADYNKLLDLNADKKIADLIDDIRLSDGYKKYRLLRRSSELMTSVDDMLTIAAMGLSPAFGIGKVVMNNLIVPAFQHLWKSYVLSRNPIDLKKQLNNKPADFRKVVRTIRKNNYRVRQDTYDTFAGILKQYDLSVEKLQAIYMDVYKAIPISQRSDKSIVNKLFKKRLAELMPELRTLIYKGKEVTDLRKIREVGKGAIRRLDLPAFDKAIQDFINSVDTSAFDNLYNALWESAVVTDAAEESIYRAYKREVEEELKQWFSRTYAGDSGTSFKDLDYQTRLAFIVSNYFEINGRRYSLSELPEFIHALNQGDPEQYRKVSALLSYMGITLENYEQVFSLLKAAKLHTEAGDEAAARATYDSLEAILKAAKSGEFLELEESESMYKTMKQVFDGAKKVDLNYMSTTEFKNLAAQFIDVGISSEMIVDIISKYPSLAYIDDIHKAIVDVVGELGHVAKYELNYAKGTYTAVDDLRSDYLDRVINFQFELNDDGAYSKENITEYITALKDLQEQVGRWMSDIKSEKVAFSTEQITMISSLNDVLQKREYKAAITNIIDLIEETDTAIYHMMLSKQGSFWLEFANFSAAQESWSKEHKAMFDSIRDPSSAYRNNLNKVIQFLRDNGARNEADYIERAIISIESYLHAIELLSSEITNYKTSKQLNDYMSGLLYNVFQYHNGKNVSDLLDKSDALTKQFTTQLNRDWPMSRIMQDLQEHNPIVPSYEDFIANVEANVNKAFSNYMGKINKIVINNPTGFHIKFGTNLFTRDTTNLLYVLGASYQDIMAKLASGEVEPRLIKDTSDFIFYMSADKITKDFDTMMDAIPYILTDIDGGQEFDTYLKSYLNDYLGRGEGSMYNIIVEAFKQIDEINDQLQLPQGQDIKVRTKDGIRKIKNITAYITKERFNEYVRQTMNVSNAYEWSTTNGMLAVKKLDKLDFLNRININPENIRFPIDIDDVTRSAELGTFYSVFRSIYNSINRYDVFKKDSIEAYRKALITLYKDPTVYWGPKNPDIYFRTADDRTIYAWYMFARTKNFDGATSSKFADILYRLGHLNPTDSAKIKDKEKIYKAVRQYTYAERIEYNENPASLFYEMEDIVNAGVTDEKAYERIIDNLPTNRITDTREFITRDLQQYYKSPKTMKANMTNVVNYHKQDVEAFERTRVIDELSKDDRRVYDVITDPKHREILRTYGINKNTKMNERSVQRVMLEERCMALADNVERWTPAELRSYIDYNTDGTLFYQGTAGFDKKYLPKEYKEAGIKIDVVDDKNNIFVITRTDNEMRPKIHTYEVPEYIFKEQQDAITEMFKGNRDYFYWDGMDVPDELFTGRMLDLDDYELLLESDNVRKAVGDYAVRKTYAKIDDKGINNFYKKKTLRPNMAMIGHYDAVNKIYELGVNTFLERGMEVPLATTDLYNCAFGGSVTAIKRVNTEHKYIHLYMNDDYSIKAMKPMFKNASDAEIKSFFERGEYTASIIRANRKGEPTIYKIHITSRADLEKAIKAGAVCLPHEVYRNAVLAINEHAISSKILRFYKQFMVATFKSMWLTTPGFLMRNFLDTAIYKNAATSGGVYDIYENMKYFSRASQLWKKYNDIQAAMLADASNKTLNKRIVRKYLRGMSPLEREQYMLVDMFAMSSASGGLSDALEEMLRIHNMSDDISIEEMWLNFYDEKILYGKYSPVRVVNDINSQIEQSSRLGLFLKLIDEGDDLTRAIRKVTETHFDYKLKEPGAQAMEEIFWFSTFPINNMMYYLNEGITKNPSMFKLHMDMLEQSYNDGEYTWEDVRNSNFLKYHLFAGNLRMKIAGQDIMLKTGSSVMSFFTMLFSPFKEAGERLNPFLAVLLGMEDLDELNPFSSFAYRLEQIRSGQSLLPSVYTKMRPKTKYQRKYYSNNYYRKSSWNPKPRKVSSYHRNMAYMNYKFTTDRYYFSRGKNIHRWLESTNAIEPNWYMNNYRHYRANGKYGRAVRKLKMPKKFKLSVSK